jgi:hypothetical protein
MKTNFEVKTSDAETAFVNDCETIAVIYAKCSKCGITSDTWEYPDNEKELASYLETEGWTFVENDDNDYPFSSCVCDECNAKQPTPYIGNADEDDWGGEV